LQICPAQIHRHLVFIQYVNLKTTCCFARILTSQDTFDYAHESNLLRLMGIGTAFAAVSPFNPDWTRFPRAFSLALIDGGRLQAEWSELTIFGEAQSLQTVAIPNQRMRLTGKRPADSLFDPPAEYWPSLQLTQ
jgi:hypothetical protein